MNKYEISSSFVFFLIFSDLFKSCLHMLALHKDHYDMTHLRFAPCLRSTMAPTEWDARRVGWCLSFVEFDLRFDFGRLAKLVFTVEQ